MKIFISLILTSMVGSALAATGNFANAMFLKSQIEISEPVYEAVEQSIVLPLSKGLHQKSTSLCWAFATLSLLESNFINENPHLADISFSREFLQRNNAEERAIRSYILKTDVFMERGTLSTAIELIQKYGLILFSSENYIGNYAGRIRNELQSFETTEQKLSNLKGIIDAIFFQEPSKVDFFGNQFTPQELAKMVLKDQNWISFGFKAGSTGEWGPHPDSDSFNDHRGWLVDPSEKESIIKRSLQAGYPVFMGFSGHGVIIYGGDYDGAGRALTYYLKDSYFHGTGFTYEAIPENVHRISFMLETIDVRSKELK